MKDAEWLAKEFLWPPDGRWMSPTMGTPRQSEDAEGQLRRGPKKKAHPILDLVRKSLERRKLKLVPSGPHDRFDPFHTEFAMLFLAAYSPHVVIRLLHEVWAANETSVPNTLGKVSSRTILSVYAKVADQLKSGVLVNRFPRGCLDALAKHHLGPWHPQTPRWLTSVFSQAEIRVPLPLARNRGRARFPSHQDPIEDSCSAVDVIISQHRESIMAQSPEEKSKRVERELKAIRKVFPDFALSEDEKLVAWDLGLSAVRERREEMLVQATPSRFGVTGTKREAGKKMTTPKGVSQASSGSARGAIDETSDSTSKEEFPRAASPEDGLSVEPAAEVDDLPANGTLKPVQLTDDHSGIAASSETGNTQDLSIPEAMDVGQSPGKTIEGLVHRFEVLGLPCEAFGKHFVLLNQFGKNFTDEEICRYQDFVIDHYGDAVVFPDLKASDPEDALEVWKNFNCKNYPEISEFSWIPEYDPRLIDLANRGYTASLLYGEKIPARFQSILFCWLVERIISWVLGLEVHRRIKKTDDDYIPWVADFFDPDIKQILEQKHPDALDPMTPLLIECFRPPGNKEPDHKSCWIPGWGALESTRIKPISEHPSAADMVTTDQLRWIRKLQQLLRMKVTGNEWAIKKYGVVADACFQMPICANYQALASVEEEWVDISMIQDFWTPQPGEEGAAAALSECKTRLHMPSIRMIERALEKRAQKA